MADIIVPAGRVTLSGVASTNVIKILEGNQTIDTAVDLSGLASGVGGIDVGGRFTGNIGDSGTNLKCVLLSAGNVIRYGAGGGNMYVEGLGSGSTSTVSKTLLIGRGTFHGIDGTFTSVEQLSGGCRIKSAAVLTTFITGGGSAEIEYNATQATTVLVDGGANVTLRRGVSGTLYVFGGSVYAALEDTAASAPAAGTIVVGGGALDWRLGDITNLWLSETGHFDASNVPVDATFTNVYGTSRAWARANIPTTTKAGKTITVTNSYIYGGEQEYVTMYGGDMPR
jgi:hypothetical protein